MFQRERIVAKRHYSLDEQCTFFEEWLRALIDFHYLDPHGRLPPYGYFVKPKGPWEYLKTAQVARVVRRLRLAGVLPQVKPRVHKGKARWTNRDLRVLTRIAEQRAMRYDHVRRLLGVFSPDRAELGEDGLLSASRTTKIIKRWEAAGLVIFDNILSGEPKWIWLTRKGLAFVQSSYRMTTPAPGTLKHLHHINRVFLFYLQQGRAFWWSSERSMQHQVELRRRERRVAHIPDAVVWFSEKPLPGQKEVEQIEIEVELTRKSAEYLLNLMRGSLDVYSSTYRPLRYFVGEGARSGVLAAFRKLHPSICTRTWVEVYDLETFELLAERFSRV
jgi:DNA-binding MarR family transcriptional regulator